MAKATKKQVLGRGLSALLKDSSINETNTNLVVGTIVCGHENLPQWT